MAELKPQKRTYSNNMTVFVYYGEILEYRKNVNINFYINFSDSQTLCFSIYMTLRKQDASN